MAQVSRVHKVLPAAGIDIGFYSTKYSLAEVSSPTGKVLLVDQFPSIAPKLMLSNVPKLTMSADLDVVVVQVDNVHFGVGKSVASLIGATGNVRAATADYCRTPLYKALFLGALFNIAKHQGCNGNLVIGVLTMGLPMTTVYDEADHIEDMALGEHEIPSPVNPLATIKVIVSRVIVVAQPQGAIVNYTAGLSHNIKSSEMCLVMDMGGGTFDWFTCSGDFVPSYMLCGATPIGALMFAGVVCDQIKPGLRGQAHTLDKIDKALRDGDQTVSIAGVEYKLEVYWPLVDGLLDEAFDQMSRQLGMLDDMDHILLTGGGATLLAKVVERRLSAYRNIVIVDKEPVFSNVKGFHRIAQMMAGDAP